VNLRGCVFDYADLGESEFGFSDLSYSTFRRADLSPEA
jgi:uncharacterized protein YjbI with pentapeptide repeats